MEEIKQDQAKATGKEGAKLPSFVSTNDVLSAFVWKVREPCKTNMVILSQACLGKSPTVAPFSA
jgi:hypothetical protein